MSKSKDKATIFAYGFDAAGFTVPSDPVETAKYVVRFIGYNAPQSLENGDGIITPSGIFENFNTSNSYIGSHTWVDCDKDHLAKRTKEVFQNYKRGGWIAFLLRQVDNGRGEWADSDLAKTFLNTFFGMSRVTTPIRMCIARLMNSQTTFMILASAKRGDNAKQVCRDCAQAQQ